MKETNTAAVGKTFNIHEPSPSQFNKCGIGSSKYKGIADSDANKDLTVGPGDEKYFAFKEGDTASISVSVPGIQGCQAGTSGKDITNCVAYLPIAVVDASHPPQETTAGGSPRTGRQRWSSKPVWRDRASPSLTTRTM